MRRTKSTACREHMVVASSSNSDDDMLLGGDQEKAPTATHETASFSMVPQRKGDGLHSRVNSPTNTRHIGRTTFQCKSVTKFVLI